MNFLNQFYVLLVNSINDKFKRMPIMETVEINNFILDSLYLIEEGFNQTNYKTQVNLLKEIKLLIYYSFAILQDDYHIGDSVLYKQFPKIDNYIFSQYRTYDILKKNINKLLLLSYSNRFKSDPQENLLSYYVFIEQIGIEITTIFDDFYSLLVSLNKKNKLYNKNNKHIDYINNNSGTYSFINLFFSPKISFEDHDLDLLKYSYDYPESIEKVNIHIMEESLLLEREILLNFN